MKPKLIYINYIIVFLVLLNFISNILLLGVSTLNSLFSGKKIESEAEKYLASKSELPNFQENKDLARLNFQELAKSEKIEYKPFVGWSRKPITGKTITVDKNGDRLHTNSVTNEYKDQAVYFFGGSNIWGRGVQDSETIPALFNSISGIPSYNKGEEGFTSRQSLARLIDLLAQGEKINLAIFYNGINDIQYHCRAELKVNEHEKTAQFREILENQRKNKASNNKQKQDNKFLQYLDGVFLAGTRKLALTISSQLFPPPTVESENQGEQETKLSVEESYICDDSKERAKKVAETLVKNWEIAYGLAEARGIKFIAILQPVAFIGEPKLDSKISLSNPEWEEELRSQYETVYPLIKKVIQEREQKWILDYSNVFSRDEYIYWDYYHVSKNGNSIIAKHLYTEIESELEKID